MNDKIAEFTVLEARISGQWQAHGCNVYENGEDGDIVAKCYGDNTEHAQEIAGFIVAMRNALPELLADIERRKEQSVRLLNQRLESARERDAALARAEKAELMCELIADKTTDIISNNDCFYPDGWRYSENIIEWAANEAAKRESSEV